MHMKFNLQMQELRYNAKVYQIIMLFIILFLQLCKLSECNGAEALQNSKKYAYVTLKINSCRCKISSINKNEQDSNNDKFKVVFENMSSKVTDDPVKSFFKAIEIGDINLARRTSPQAANPAT